MPDKPPLRIFPQNNSLVLPKMSRKMSRSRKTRKVKEGFQFRGLERHDMEVVFGCFLFSFVINGITGTTGEILIRSVALISAWYQC